MAEPKDLIVPMLGEMRSQMDTRFDGIDVRLDKIESRQKSFNNALTADTMISKFVTGDFEERLGALEKKVETLLSEPRSRI